MIINIITIGCNNIFPAAVVTEVFPQTETFLLITSYPFSSYFYQLFLLFITNSLETKSIIPMYLKNNKIIFPIDISVDISVGIPGTFRSIILNHNFSYWNKLLNILIRSRNLIQDIISI